jgi:alkanesulfonate monooxygenase
VLRQHCEAVGRDYDEIEKTVLGTIHLAPGEMEPARVVESCQEFAEIGFSHAIFNMPNVHDITPLDVVGRDVLPHIADL